MKRRHAAARSRPLPGQRRSVCWLEPPGPHGFGVLEITACKLVIAYRCREIAQDFGPEHRAFELHKLDECFEPTDVVYHVLLDFGRQWHCCDCLGHTRHGHCKHCAALAALSTSPQARAPLMLPVSGTDSHRHS